MQKATPALSAQPVALAPDGGDVAMVEHPVQDRGDDDRVAEDTAPFADGPVRSDEQRASLVAAADQLEEQMLRIRLDGQIRPDIVIHAANLLRLSIRLA